MTPSQTKLIKRAEREDLSGEEWRALMDEWLDACHTGLTLLKFEHAARVLNYGWYELNNGVAVPFDK